MKNLALHETPKPAIRDVRAENKLKTGVKAGAYSGPASALYMFLEPAK